MILYWIVAGVISLIKELLSGASKSKKPQRTYNQAGVKYNDVQDYDQK